MSAGSADNRMFLCQRMANKSPDRGPVNAPNTQAVCSSKSPSSCSYTACSCCSVYAVGIRSSIVSASKSDL